MTHSIKELNSVLKELKTKGFSLSELVTMGVFNCLVDVSEDLDESLEDVIDDWLEDNYDDVYVDHNLLKSLVTAKL
jgi:hypothetical protein